MKFRIFVLLTLSLCLSLSYKVSIFPGFRIKCDILKQQRLRHRKFDDDNVSFRDEFPRNPTQTAVLNARGALRNSALVAGFSYILLRKPVQSLSADLKLCSDSLTHLEGPDGKDVFLIGTAHISEESANFVRQVINKVSPDVVMIELDAKRIGRVGESKTLEETGFDIPPQTLSELSERAVQNDQPYFFHLYRQFTSLVSGWVKGAAGLLLGQALSSFYKSIEKLGFVAGGEFVAAVQAGRAIGARILLGDRDVDITLQRLSLALSNTNPDR